VPFEAEAARALGTVLSFWHGTANLEISIEFFKIYGIKSAIKQAFLD
jgi:hypothetical protein